MEVWGEKQSNVQSPTSKGKTVRSAEGEEKPPDTETPFDRLRAGGDAVTRGKGRHIDLATGRLSERSKPKKYYNSGKGLI